ncbi:MAG: hypothetical protein RMM30_02165 [Armatimonadota bacterium]|nr:hypothetical protein [Armatimonadota bacterium]MDW8155377.1 hypothetical protein [Armatimonadota bacterium]
MLGRHDLHKELEALDDLLFRTDPSGRRLFFPSGTTRPGRVVPDQEAERQLRQLLERRTRVLSLVVTGVTLPSALLLLFLKRILDPVVGGWAALAITGVVAMAELAFLSAVVVAVALSYQRQLSSMVAGWPEAPPLHSWQEAARERWRVSASATPAWKLLLYLTGSLLLALGGLAMLVLAKDNSDRLVGALVMALFGVASLVFALQLARRLLST